MPEVILVNDSDIETGAMEKLEAHQKGVLHRAFSIFIFNSKGEMLLQQRADEKYHSPGLWTNTCCSHPEPGKEIMAEAKKRLKEEMGFTTELYRTFEFKYRASFDNGLTEHEYDHVFTGMYDGPVIPDRSEVKDYKYMSLTEIKHELYSSPEIFTAWFRIAFPEIEKHLNGSVNKFA